MDAKERRNSALEFFGNVDVEKDVEDKLERETKNEIVLHFVKEKRNSVDTISRRKKNWLGHIMRAKGRTSKKCYSYTRKAGGEKIKMKKAYYDAG